MQSDSIVDDEEKHFVFIYFVNIIHHENFIINFQNDLKIFVQKKEMIYLIATIFLKYEESIVVD
jgi:hypothetical protein